MNLRYIGDALDHWKGSLLEYLQRAELLRNLAVDPMTSDGNQWSDDDRGLFAQLLKIKPHQLLSHHNSLGSDRPAYFQELSHPADLFLDPDTGIATGKVKTPVHYLFASELHDLLGRRPHRVVGVYQHIRAQRTRDRLQNIVAVLQRPASPFACCSYESGSVAMLFLSQSRTRIDPIYDKFVSLLNKHAERRIYRWYHMPERTS